MTVRLPNSKIIHYVIIENVLTFILKFLLCCFKLFVNVRKIISKFVYVVKKFVGHLRTSLNDCELAKRAKEQKNKDRER